MRPLVVLTLATAIAMSLLGTAPPAAAQKVDVAVALAADVSRSIDQEEFELQRQGYAAAITSPQFLAAIEALPNGAVALCFIEWAGIEQQAVVVNWAIIRDRQSAAAFAEQVRAAPRTTFGRTAIGDGIDFAVAQLQAFKIDAGRRVIDVSGDGTSNSGRSVTAARDDAVAKGITINGLAIINEKTGGEVATYLYYHTHPPGGLQRYYADNVIGGPGAFALQIVNFEAFADAMTEKLVLEISAIEPGSALAAAVSRR
jgi:hypothetical protein